MVKFVVIQAGFPSGAVNFLPGDVSECGNAAASHGHIDKVAFTKSIAGS